MTDLFAVALGLLFVLVIYAVETSVEIILVTAPGNACHHVNAISAIPPGLDAIRQLRVNPIHNRHVRTQIAERTPRTAGLETSAFQRLIGVRWKSGRIGRRPAEFHRYQCKGKMNCNRRIIVPFYSLRVI